MGFFSKLFGKEQEPRVEGLIHHIGESYGGGIVFYVDDSRQHGLIAATSDQSTGMEWNNAIQICANYRGGGYGNWYLPSKYELNLLYQQKIVVGGFVNNYYWSSTENSRDGAWAQFFDLGDQGKEGDSLCNINRRHHLQQKY